MKRKDLQKLYPNQIVKLMKNSFAIQTQRKSEIKNARKIKFLQFALINLRHAILKRKLV